MWKLVIHLQRQSIRLTLLHVSFSIGMHTVSPNKMFIPFKHIDKIFFEACLPLCLNFCWVLLVKFLWMCDHHCLHLLAIPNDFFFAYFICNFDRRKLNLNEQTFYRLKGMLIKSIWYLKPAAPFNKPMTDQMTNCHFSGLSTYFLIP